MRAHMVGPHSTEDEDIAVASKGRSTELRPHGPGASEDIRV